MNISIPAKTFLLGEYVVLEGGPALIACTQPFFSLHISLHSHLEYNGIHPESPAGKFISDHLNFFQDKKIEFIDPYYQAGGLGASTAQFLGCYQAIYNKHSITMKDIPTLLDCYQHYAWNGQGTPPSGADLVAQSQGELCYFHRNQHELKQFTWPFTHLRFLLIRTHQKIATHEHLKTLKQPPRHTLEKIVLQAMDALENKDSDFFITAIHDYQRELEHNHLTLATTQTLLSQLKQHPDCLAAKGCGALGADIVLTIVPLEKHETFRQWINNNTIGETV